LLLAACGGQSADYVLTEDTEPEIEANAYKTTEPDTATVPTADTEPVEPTREAFEAWQYAYAELLREYAMLILGHSPCGYFPNEPGGFFILYDIDTDGVPELIVADRFHFTSYFAAYTFSDGSIMPLEAEYFYDYGTRFFALPDNNAGIGMESNEGVFNSAALLVIDGHRLIPKFRLSRWESWEASRTLWSINGDEVTEIEHDEMYDKLFGRWYERDLIFHHEITEANIQDIVFGWEAPMPTPEPWQYAYVELLREYAEREIGEYAYEYMPSAASGMFTLHDIDKDGIPELIIWEFSQGGYFLAYAAYTFTDGNIAPLDIGRGVGGRGHAIFPTPDNMPGIILTSGGSGYNLYTFVRMDGHSLVVEVSAFVNWSSWQSGYEYSLHYIRGMDISPVEFPESLDWIEYEHHRERLSFGYTLVSEEEFNRVLDDVFGDLSADLGLWPPEINEANIQHVIFGWQSHE